MYVRDINHQFVTIKGFMLWSNEKKRQFCGSSKMSYIKCVWENDEAPWVVPQQESMTHPSLQPGEPIKQDGIYIT